MTSATSDSEGCYCIQAHSCPHWILSAQHPLSLHPPPLDENGIGGRDHRPLIYELQRELRLAVLEIEKITQASRDLTRINQDLEESRLLAISDQARTAKRLLLMSSQLEYTEQKLFSLTKETEDGLKDSDLLRIERIKREALQEREDAGRLKIDALQDELREVQRSERTLQQKLLTIQTKYETLGQRYDQLRRQQQEVDLARESKEAVAWLKETTDRLCSPPQGSLGQAIQQEKSLQQGSTPINIARSDSPTSSSSPPYQSSIVDPPLAAQNQFISLIKELATANSTLRSELTEYRDLLQDSRNEVMDLRSQIEDYEQGHGFECCGGSFMQDGPGDLTISQGTWGTAMVEHQDLSVSKLKDPARGPLSGASPPPYMTAHGEHPPGNVFGELERLYSQGNQIPPHLSSRHRSSRHHSSKKDKEAGASSGRRRTSRDHSSRDHTKSSHHHHNSKHGHHSHQSHHNQHNNTATVSTSTSTSEARRVLVPTGTPSKVLAPASTEVKPRRTHDSKALAHSRRMSSKKSLYTDADMDMLGSESDRNEYDQGSDDDQEQGDPAEFIAEMGDSGNEQEPGFVAAFAEALSFLSFFSGPLSGSPP
ncbi:hypothetical protein BG015_009682 [Linnemannia schmuckeri]|uniref:Uncharacterized protein n=1 Tax=Linnemannia schmuckeri TaxID=64567 RepID=A0A9P5S7Z6_9FUNG|nr:hypothetical protein BG015_009682 [Linnemannia schmuckeri]